MQGPTSFQVTSHNISTNPANQATTTAVRSATIASTAVALIKSHHLPQIKIAALCVGAVIATLVLGPTLTIAAVISFIAAHWIKDSTAPAAVASAATPLTNAADSGSKRAPAVAKIPNPSPTGSGSALTALDATTSETVNVMSIKANIAECRGSGNVHDQVKSLPDVIETHAAHQQGSRITSALTTVNNYLHNTLSAYASRAAAAAIPTASPAVAPSTATGAAISFPSSVTPAVVNARITFLNENIDSLDYLLNFDDRVHFFKAVAKQAGAYACIIGEGGSHPRLDEIMARADPSLSAQEDRPEANALMGAYWNIGQLFDRLNKMNPLKRRIRDESSINCDRAVMKELIRVIITDPVVWSSAMAKAIEEAKKNYEEAEKDVKHQTSTSYVFRLLRVARAQQKLDFTKLVSISAMATPSSCPNILARVQLARF